MAYAVVFERRRGRSGFAPNLVESVIAALKRVYRALPLGQRTRARVRSLLRWTSRVFWGWRPQSPVQPPAPAASNRPDYIIFSVIDWHFRIQRPQHLAADMVAAGHRVFYVSSELAEHPRPGFRSESLDGSGRLFQVRLHGRDSPAIYYSTASPPLQRQLEEDLAIFLAWSEAKEVVCLVEHPFWAQLAARVEGAKLVYDCMDYHEGFGTFGDDLRQAERQLIRTAGLTVVTSVWLRQYVAPFARRVALVRNAADYAHFATIGKGHFSDPKGRRVIGYFGALAQWLDVDLVRSVAEQNSHCLILILGHDQANVKRALGDLRNVRLLGEVPYQELPYFLHGFDLCLLPFRILPLTLATDPVKLYEYLSAGKPVVSVDLPEARECDGMIRVAKDRDDFLRLVRDALDAKEDRAVIAQRQAFAATQTWQERGRTLRAAVDAVPWADGG